MTSNTKEKSKEGKEIGLNSSGITEKDQKLNCDKKNKRIANGKSLREEKRRKYEQKLTLQKEQMEIEEKRKRWIQSHSDLCTNLTSEMLTKLFSESENSEKINAKTKAVAENTSNALDEGCLASLHQLLEPYVDLKNTNENSKNSDKILAEKQLFVAEGTETVRTLIQQSKRNCGMQLCSILVKPSTFFDMPVKLMEDVLSCLEKSDKKNKRSFHIFIADEKVLSGLIGFHLQRGALACGIPICHDEAWLFGTYLEKKDDREPCRILALDGICDTANLGSVIRTAAATGMDLIVLSKDSCNPWSRRSVRVSMGHVSTVPIIRCNKMSLDKVLSNIQEKHNFEAYAAILDQSAQRLDSIQMIESRWCCVLGNEQNGVTQDVITACKKTVRIGMDNRHNIYVDSFSLPVATGILLHGLITRES